MMTEKIIISFLPTQNEPDTNCCLFTKAFPTEVLGGKSLIDAVFAV